MLATAFFLFFVDGVGSGRGGNEFPSLRSTISSGLRKKGIESSVPSGNTVGSGLCMHPGNATFCTPFDVARFLFPSDHSLIFFFITKYQVIIAVDIFLVTFFFFFKSWLVVSWA